MENTQIGAPKRYVKQNVNLQCTQSVGQMFAILMRYVCLCVFDLTNSNDFYFLKNASLSFDDTSCKHTSYSILVEFFCWLFLF